MQRGKIYYIGNFQGDANFHPEKKRAVVSQINTGLLNPKS